MDEGPLNQPHIFTLTVFPKQWVELHVSECVGVNLCQGISSPLSLPVSSVSKLSGSLFNSVHEAKSTECPGMSSFFIKCIQPVFVCVCLS